MLLIMPSLGGVITIWAQSGDDEPGCCVEREKWSTSRL